MFHGAPNRESGDSARASAKKKSTKGTTSAKSGARPITFVNIPKLKGRDLRKMLRLSGHSLAHFSRYMGRSRSWASEVIVPLSNVSTSTVEGLYTMLGHDQFWTVYTRATGCDVPAESVLEGEDE
ncbi:MAG: hypothetical protein JSS89_12055 [Bacteroidetes bacterium]|nr:hypothetical protein [Bacteroidota bacterium]